MKSNLSRTSFLSFLSMTILSVPLVAPRAAVIDTFDFDDGTPINFSSTGEFNSGFDSGLPTMATIGGARVAVARAFQPTDRFEMSINDPSNGSEGVARIRGFTGDSTPITDRSGGGLIWDGGTDDIGNNDLGLAPLDLSGERGLRLNFTDVSGEIWVWFNIIENSPSPFRALATEFKTVTEMGVIDFLFSDLTLDPDHLYFEPDLTVEQVLQNVGSISLNFRSSNPGAFDIKLDSVQTIAVPEPSVWMLGALASSLLSLRALKRNPVSD